MSMTNRDTVTAFARGSARGRSGHGTIFFDGNVLYSYGTHWPLAFRVGPWATPGAKMYVNTDRYSRTTSKHMGLVRNAAAKAGYLIEPVDIDRMREIVRKGRP